MNRSYSSKPTNPSPTSPHHLTLAAPKTCEYIAGLAIQAEVDRQMPRIFDNINAADRLLPALQQTLNVSESADFCVGYFNLRGWKNLAKYVDKWEGASGQQCRLLVGMQRLPEEDVRLAMGLAGETEHLDNRTALRLKKSLAEEFKRQLTIGAPTNEDEAGLKQLSRQLRERSWRSSSTFDIRCMPSSISCSVRTITTT